jgi:phage repressor protein C with HTH and peptisase S24 domain
MLKHADIWTAIDRLARESGLTASGLARRAGLDPTTFNRSKRITREGKARWPSTESIAKILDATGTNLAHFVGLVRSDESSSRQASGMPLSSLQELRLGNHFDADGRPSGEWDEITLPDVADPQAFALEITDDELEPIYHDGDVLIVSPAAAPRRGDRVFVRTAAGEILIGRLLRRTPKRLDMQSLAQSDSQFSMRNEQVLLLARIVWVSQ